MLNANSHYRVSIWPTPSTTHARPISQICGGYHGAKLRRYQEFIEVLTPERAAHPVHSVGQLQPDCGPGAGLAMLNTRYLLVPGAEQPLPFNGGLGPAWFVDEVQWVNTAEEEIGAVADLNPARTAAVNNVRRGPRPPRQSGFNEVRLRTTPKDPPTRCPQTKEGCSSVKCITRWADGPGGRGKCPWSANALLSALKAPAGHEVQLQYEPEGWGTAWIESCLVDAVVFCGWMHRREAE